MRCDGCSDEITMADAVKLDETKKKVYHRRCWRAKQADNYRAERAEMTETIEVVEKRVQKTLGDYLKQRSYSSFAGMKPPLHPEANVPMDGGCAAMYLIEAIKDPDFADLRKDLRKIMEAAP